MPTTLHKDDRIVCRDCVIVALRACRLSIHGEYVVERAPKPSYERATVLAALDSTHWNRAAAAKQLGYSPATLGKKITQFGLCEPGDCRDS